jgi:hypothetical protein
MNNPKTTGNSIKHFYHLSFMKPVRIVRDSLRSYLSKEEHWMRVVMNRSVSEKINNLGPKTLNALEVSGTDNSKFNWNSYVNYMYPDFDLINPGKISERFDIVICEQVLEHVTNPFKAAETLYDLLELGGTVIVSTPFLIKLHGMPQDYWRFTPSAIKLILETAGFSQIEVHTWGNRRSVIGNLGWWQGYRFYHSLRNDPSLPIMVWAFAKKVN